MHYLEHLESYELMNFHKGCVCVKEKGIWSNNNPLAVLNRYFGCNSILEL